ncbi:hypothetical protein DFR50_123108 [Roseiarcus fermentans]|uniref:Uncharacterized protein n=1 Tax=Roseiarcus fermentans TaxID=1473586 RepID=A0A366F4R2_9HYPH|nr:hypothetical protein [Roseiarcus fermentans]RBP09136.1 hypothetical protein DFR50_123108 [Roseiarcus fermentans]
MSKRPKAADGPGEPESEVDRDLDEALDESFPASDPPAMTRRSTAAPGHPAPKPRPRNGEAQKKP